MYTTSTNTITIQSETLGQDFVGIQIDDENNVTLIEGTDYNLSFTNYEVPFDVSTIDRMLARSPRYVNTPFYFDTTTKATIALKIWEGSFTTDEPSEATQTIDKVRPTIDYSEFNTNISQVASNYLQSTPSIPLSSTSYVVAANDGETVWLRYTASYTDPSEEVSDVTGYLAASDGYTEFLNGVNYSYAQYLTTIPVRNIASNGIVILPIPNNGYYSEAVISSTPTNENGTNTIALSTTNESTDFVQYVHVDVSDFTTDTVIRIALDKTAGGKDVLEYKIVPECRYPQKTIIFKNKYGYFDVLSMVAKNSETLNVEKSEFINNYISNGTYATTTHQRKDINIFATKKIVCNSGHIKEDESSLYEEMLLSDQVWFYNGGTLIPIKPITKTMNYKTRINDGLIEYQIEFDYAYNQINNV